MNFLCKISKFYHFVCLITKEIAACLTFALSLPQIYIDKRNHFGVERNTPKQLVEKVAGDIAKLLNRKRKALEVSSANNRSLPAGSPAVDNRGVKLLSVALKKGIDF